MWICGINSVNCIRGIYIKEKIVLISNYTMLFIANKYKLIKKIILGQFIKNLKPNVENNSE